MKKSVLTYLLTLIITGSLYAQTSPAPKTAALSKAQIKFDNTVHDFGVIPYLGNCSHIFVITNAGTEPLIITNCIKSCGCTSVDWTKDPILPGNKGMVKATYNTRIKGPFSRGVVVYSNDPNSLMINLRLTGTVENDPTIKNNQTTNALKTPVEKW